MKKHFRQLILAAALFAALLGLILFTAAPPAGISPISSFIWFVVLGRIFLAVATGLALWGILRRLRKDQNRLDNLSFKLEEEAQSNQGLMGKLKQRGVAVPLPEQELHAENRLALSIPHPHVVDYIQEARGVGLDDGAIRQELAQAGWDAEEINQALKAI